MRLAKNPISLLGIIITTVSGILIFVLTIMGFLEYLANPYVGIITFLILPAFFITGLASHSDWDLADQAPPPPPVGGWEHRTRPAVSGLEFQ